MKSATYKFSEFYLNPFNRTLQKNDSPVEISSKTFDFLLLLVKKSGETVTKEEILDAVWGKSFVEEGNLTVHISKLRKLLGANKRQPLIKTVTGRGYQFVANVEIVRNSEGADNMSSHVPVGQPTHHPPFKPDSIAVLPLRNENGDEEIDYLADGITESLINSLSYMPDFRVIARDTVFRYRDTQLDAQELGRKLNVATILTGRLRIIKGNLIIGVELIRVEDGIQVWGTQINQPFTDIFEVQEEITSAIAKSLVSKTSPLMIASLPGEFTQNAESYRNCLKARFLLETCTLENINIAIGYFNKSIRLDPTNVLPYVGMAECYFWLNAYAFMSREECCPIMNKFIDQARSINEEVPELYVLRAEAAKGLSWEFEKSANFFKKALEINPNHVNAIRGYSHLLALFAKFSESLAMLHRLRILDPISSRNSIAMGKIFYTYGQYENAIRELNEALELDPNNYMALGVLGCVFIELEETEKAIDSFKRAFLSQEHEEFETLIAYTYARSGCASEARKILNRLQKRALEIYVPYIHFAKIYTGLGDHDKAFQQLEMSFRNREEALSALKINPRFAPLRNDPRFNRLLRRIGLPTANPEA